MKNSLFILIFTLFAPCQALLAQKFTTPRIIAEKFDKWFLERLLREKLKIPYSTITIEKFEQSLRDKNYDNLGDDLKQFILKGEIYSLIGDFIERIVVHWKGNVNYSFHFTVNMPGALTYHLGCRITDYQDQNKLYFNICKAQYRESSVISFGPLDDDAFKRHFSKFCRDCDSQDTLLKNFSEIPDIVHLLQVRESWPLSEKPYLDYTDFYDPPHLVDFVIDSDKYYFGGGDYEHYRKFDFYDFIHPYFSYGVRIGITPFNDDLSLPEGRDEGLLLKKSLEVRVVNENYRDNEPHCILKKGYTIGRSGLDIWKKGEVFFFSHKLGGDIPLPHKFHQKYFLFPLDFSDGEWLTMQCFGTPLLSFGELLEMIEGKFRPFVIN